MKKPVLILLISILIPVVLFAQEEEKPKKYENAEWYRVSYVKFHAGKKQDAFKIIKEFYRPVADKLGRDYTSYEPVSGEWDMITFFKLQEGISVYEWETSPSGIEWRKELLQQVGSKEKIREISEQFESCVLERKVEIVRKKVW
jgi:hypothetical protein